jgi:glutamate-ammonia-ligase adenylyltransferase
VASLQGEGRQRFEAFLPLLCEMAAHEANPDAALTRALPFVRAVCRRSAYLVLLQENPAALKHLLSLVAASTWVADRLASRPELLDELLHETQLFSAPSRDEIKALVRQQLLRIPEEDLEGQMGALSRIKEGVILRVAASELSGTLPVMQVSDNLTFLAEVMIEQAIAVARAELVQRYGEPQAEQVGFAVMAYGKLGGIELSYGSDLDLVFVFNGAEGQTGGPKVIDNSRFYTRLAQRVTHVLSAQMFSGRLYEVDLRLRPDGDSGLVATTLTGFRRYQLESAWTWEHQALVRSRTVAGDPSLRASLEQLRREVLTLPREAPVLSAAVRDMRHKMLAEQASMNRGGERFDIKRDQGGIVDIEFVVQYLVLAHASEFPELAQWSDVIRLLETLEKVGVLSEDQAAVLSSRYLIYRSALHGLALQGADTRVEAAAHVAGREQVKRVTEALLPGLQVT